MKRILSATLVLLLALSFSATSLAASSNCNGGNNGYFYFGNSGNGGGGGNVFGATQSQLLDMLLNNWNSRSGSSCQNGGAGANNSNACPNGFGCVGGNTCPNGNACPNYNGCTTPKSRVPNTGCAKSPSATTPPTATPQPPVSEIPEQPSASLSAYAAEVVALVNKERKNAGLNELTVDKGATAAAELRAKEIVTRFSHTRPNGSSCFTALQELKVSYRSAGENIANGYRSAEKVMEGWMNSKGHRDNILGSGFTKIGVGCYEQNGRLHWVQFFIS